MLPTDSLRPLTAIYVDSMISLDSMTLVIRVLSAAWYLYFEKNFKMEFELGCQRDMQGLSTRAMLLVGFWKLDEILNTFLVSSNSFDLQGQKEWKQLKGAICFWVSVEMLTVLIYILILINTYILRGKVIEKSL